VSRTARILAAALGVVVGLAPAASACPSCSVGQGLETLAYVLAFMAIPYLVVSGVLYWVRRVIHQERGL
jgi:hypothetical protein